MAFSYVIFISIRPTVFRLLVRSWVWMARLYVRASNTSTPKRFEPIIIYYRVYKVKMFYHLLLHTEEELYYIQCVFYSNSYTTTTYGCWDYNSQEALCASKDETFGLHLKSYTYLLYHQSTQHIYISLNSLYIYIILYIHPVYIYHHFTIISKPKFVKRFHIHFNIIDPANISLKQRRHEKAAGPVLSILIPLRRSALDPGITWVETHLLWTPKETCRGMNLIEVT